MRAIAWLMVFVPVGDGNYMRVIDLIWLGASAILLGFAGAMAAGIGG